MTPKKIEIPIAIGNRKLPATTAITNIVPALLCPSRALGMCQLDKCGLGARHCYALKAEKQYSTVVPYRLRQQTWWDQDAGLMCTGFAQWLERRRNKILAVRVGEAGDFRTKEDVFKMKQLALCHKELTWYCYTARKDLFTAKVLKGMPLNVTVNGSGWLAHNNFVVLGPLNSTQVVDAMCPGDCRICSRCLVRAGKTIGIKPH